MLKFWKIPTTRRGRRGLLRLSRQNERSANVFTGATAPGTVQLPSLLTREPIVFLSSGPTFAISLCGIAAPAKTDVENVSRRKLKWATSRDRPDGCAKRGWPDPSQISRFDSRDSLLRSSWGIPGALHAVAATTVARARARALNDRRRCPL
ncbi:hypothetical protein BDY21DRAFT_160723 [Lineolata rhizophorae]|uniref:Uncharacterized protein n=1 Tax=Lineolata rhizophorae TaxID=578093 RepID=A0A6A6P8U6_9PEZI|nr:hypothetical protein BDY21DRAFT_160723 [Lineolata rhizophorae]